MLLAGWGAAAAGVWLLAGDALTVVAEPAANGGAAALTALPFQDALLGLCAVVLVGSVGWLLVTGTVAVAAHLAERHAPHSRPVRTLCRVNERTCPGWVRRFVTAALGAALSTGLASVPAHAEPPPGPDHGGDGVTGRAAPVLAAARLVGLAVPDRPTGGGPARPRAARADQAALANGAAQPHRGPAPGASVLVGPGESLWSISEDLLTETATDQEVTAAWHRLHHANARRIGPDPDLIHPGTRLVVPDLSVPHGEEAR